MSSIFTFVFGKNQAIKEELLILKQNLHENNTKHQILVEQIIHIHVNKFKTEIPWIEDIWMMVNLFGLWKTWNMV